MNSKTTDISSVSFPTISELKDFYIQSLGIRPESDEQQAAEVIKEIIEMDWQIPMRDDSRKFIVELIDTTRKYLSTGFYDIESEIFTKFDKKRDLDEHVVDLLVEIYLKLTDLDVNQGELFFDKRLDVILITPRKGFF